MLRLPAPRRRRASMRVSAGPLRPNLTRVRRFRERVYAEFAEIRGGYCPLGGVRRGRSMGCLVRRMGLSVGCWLLWALLGAASAWAQAGSGSSGFGGGGGGGGGGGFSGGGGSGSGSGNPVVAVIVFGLF